MEITAAALPDLSELIAFVRERLCQTDRLDPRSTPFFWAPVQRRGKPCGRVFHIEGPRLVKTSAVWAGDEHRIVFYDSTGNRTAEVRLSESPDLGSLSCDGSNAATSTASSD